MTTLMQWGNSEGIQGRCDAKCHNAQGPDCDWIRRKWAEERALERRPADA